MRHFIVQLPGRPARVARVRVELEGGGVDSEHLAQRVDARAHVEIGEDLAGAGLGSDGHLPARDVAYDR